MPSVNRILDLRAHRVTAAQRRRATALSIILHGSLVGGVWASSMFGDDEPKKRPIAPVVRIVTPAALGIQKPKPPPPKPQRKPPPKPPPKTPPPPPPASVDVPVIPVKRKVEQKPAPEPPPPEPHPATPEPPKPRGVLRGNPLGASDSTSVGVEDPDFTYGYYVRQLVAAVSANWRRPPVPERTRDARFYFRIQRDGMITELRMLDASGSEVFDDAAQRAIEISRLPPLPRGYAKDYLGITVVMR